MTVFKYYPMLYKAYIINTLYVRHIQPSW